MTDFAARDGLPDTLPALVERAARLWPDQVAWTFDETGEDVTFADVDARTEQLADVLVQLGVRPGDRVAVMLDNCAHFPLCWLAISRLGAATVPVNINYQRFDARHLLVHSDVQVVLTTGRFLPLLNELQPDTAIDHIVDLDQPLPAAPRTTNPKVVPEDIANVQYTSGTTGAPKGCLLPNNYWTVLAAGLIEDFPHINDTDIILTAQPFHYVDPQWNVALGLMSGAQLIILDRFHPSTFFTKVVDYQVTWFYCLGLMPTLLLQTEPHPREHDHCLRAISASAIPPALQQGLEQRWGVGWYEAFGMTETGGDIRLTDSDHDEVVGTGCLGRPTRDREAMIIDDEGNPLPREAVGELVLRGRGLMHGYFRDQQATDLAFRGGWFHTGDLARMDEQGRVFHHGRTKDMIRRSGENISADEVERALQLHPKVQLVAVLPREDTLRGEEVHAVVVLQEPGVSPDELIAFCQDQLAYFKVPRYWTFLDQLPMTASERVAKAVLATQLIQQSAVQRYDRTTGEWQ